MLTLLLEASTTTPMDNRKYEMGFFSTVLWRGCEHDAMEACEEQIQSLLLL